MLTRTNLLRAFVEDLASADQTPGFQNPYQTSHAAHNLFEFLRLHDPSSRACLLVGEAPGYRGAAVSGVPFTSLSVLLEWTDDPWGAFGHNRYRAPASAMPPHQREATATMVWRTLNQELASEPLPLTWNAVPFHPYGSSLQSNRPLRRTEVMLGLLWLERLMEIFPQSRPLAVGRTASWALGSIGADHVRIRHPSHGGLRGFRRGIIDHKLGL